MLSLCNHSAIFLALTFGLEDDPPDAIARAVGLVESVGERHGVKFPFQGSIATTDGEGLCAFRYSSEGRSRSLFYTTDVPTLRKLYPTRALLKERSPSCGVTEVHGADGVRPGEGRFAARLHKRGLPLVSERAT